MLTISEDVLKKKKKKPKPCKNINKSRKCPQKKKTCKM